MSDKEMDLDLKRLMESIESKKRIWKSIRKYTKVTYGCLE
jgi:hypothetical protein